MENQIFYHFLSSSYAIQDLERKRIKVSRLNSLNDPFELMPYKRYPSDKRKLYDKVFGRINKKWGLLCFTESWEEQLLWAHYAEGHKGIALGFEISINEVIKVTYSSDEKRSEIELTDDPNENETNFLKLANIKYKLWAYEKEYRLLVKLDECVFEDPHYFLPFGDGIRLRKIVLGCRFDHKNERDNICRLASQLNAEVIPTRQGWQDYKIRINGARISQYQ